MRNFYIFYINKEFKNIMHDNPYSLFKTLENIYYLDKSDLEIGSVMFDQIAVPFKKDDVNKYIFNSFKDNDFYMNIRNSHKLYNKYREEYMDLETHFAYLKLNTNMSKVKVFEKIYINTNLFVCDFANKDYFWVDKVLEYS